MGELGGNQEDSIQVQLDKEKMPTPDGQFDTDVPNIFSDAQKDGLPVFKVTKGEFYQNMSNGRQRLRFKKDTSASSYMKNTNYKRAFWIQDNEEGFMRKIK